MNEAIARRLDSTIKALSEWKPDPKGPGGSRAARKTGKLRNALTKHYTAAMRANERGDMVEAVADAKRGVQAVEAAGGVMKAKRVGPKGDVDAYIYTDEMQAANHRYALAMVDAMETEFAKAKQQPDTPDGSRDDKLYQGHKGPGIGHLKPDQPDRRDGDSDTVVAERRPRKSDQYEKSPLRMAAALARRLRGKRPKPSRRGQQPVTGLKSAPGSVPGVRVVSR